VINGPDYVPGYPLAWTHAKAPALFSITQTHTHTEFSLYVMRKHAHRPKHSLSYTHRGPNALETNYQSGVSSYIYLFSLNGCIYGHPQELNILFQKKKNN